MDFNMVIKQEINNIKLEPLDDFPDIDIPNSSEYNEDIPFQCIVPKLEFTDPTDQMENKVINQSYPIQNPQSESETDDMYDECYSCFMCNVSYNTQFDLDAHLHTHTDDDTFHHSNINSISEPLPQSSIKPSKFFRCNECHKICKSQLSYNEHMLTHTGEKPHHCRVCDRKFRHIANFRAHLKSHTNVKTLICSLCQKTIVGEKNYYIHYMDVHNKMSIRSPRPYQSSSSDSDEDFNPKLPYCKKKKLSSRKFRKDIEPFGPLFAKKAWEKRQRDLENDNLDAEEEKSERDAVQEAIESSRLDIQNMLRRRKQLLTDYNTEESQKILENIIQEKNSSGKIDEAKFSGPLFWKNALLKAGLIEYILPMQFQGQLRVIQCMNCRKCFARLPLINDCNISTSKPPCSSCFMIKDESALMKHKDESHGETLSPYICKECLFESNTWYAYVQHMKMHLRYASKCSECVYNLMHIPDKVIFLCHVCEMSFESDDELKTHVQTHFEHGQNYDSQ